MAISGPFRVAFGEAFAYGALAAKVEPLRDFEASRPGAPVQARDKDTGLLLWAVDVIDLDPDARERSLRVKVAAPVQPVLPAAVAGLPFHPVAFDGLTVTPYVNGNGRIAYALRASGLHAPDTGAGGLGASAGASRPDGSGAA